VIQIDIAPEELGRNYPNSLGIAGDAKAVLGQLISCAAPGSRREWKGQVKGYLADTLRRQQELKDIDETPIHTGRLCALLQDFLPDDAILVSDTGYSAIWTSTMIRMRPGQTYIRAAGSLGWAVPASIGAKVAKPDRPVICFTGDGGFYYHLAELETAVRNGINTVVVINNNGMLAQCLGSVTYRNDPELGKKALSFSNISFAQVAEALGAYGQRVDRADAVSGALRNALDSGRPSVVEVITNPYGSPRPPVEQ
jgi:acetolactate synthase-1/2/3 large subunit